MSAQKWTPALQGRYDTLRAKVRDSYVAKDRNTEPKKQEALDNKWLKANAQLDGFCEKYM